VVSAETASRIDAVTASPGQRERGLLLRGCERADVDQAGHLVAAGGRFGDDHATVRVADEDHGPVDAVDAVDDVADVGGVAGHTAKWVGSPRSPVYRTYRGRHSATPRTREEAPMAIFTKTHVLTIARRAYGADYAETLTERLPERLDLDNDADTELLFQLGLTPDRLASALGAEL
jgi:hypothetical protein